MPGLKTGVKNDIVWSEIETGFGEVGGTPLPRIPRSTPPPLPGLCAPLVSKGLLWPC